jgi:hypothetical protein
MAETFCLKSAEFGMRKRGWGEIITLIERIEYWIANGWENYRGSRFW